MGLVPVQHAIRFEQIPEGTGRYDYTIIAASDTFRFIACMFGAGSVLHAWYSVCVAEVSKEQQGELGIHGAYVLYSKEKNHRTKEKLQSFKDDFTAGWRLALAPIRAEEKRSKEADAAARLEEEESVFSYFYNLEYAYWDHDALLEVNFAKNKRFPGFFNMVKVNQLIGTDRRIRIHMSTREREIFHNAPHLHKSGKMVHGTIRPVEYARHLRIWIEHNPEDPSNGLYERVAEHIEWKLKW